MNSRQTRRIAANIAKLPMVPSHIMQEIPMQRHSAKDWALKTSNGLPSHERISKLTSRLLVLALAPAIIRWPAQKPPIPPSLTARRCQVD